VDLKCVVTAKNEAAIGSVINLAIARAYLQAADPKLVQRAWQDVMNEFVCRAMKDSSRDRKQRAVNAKLFGPLRRKKLVETTADGGRPARRAHGQRTGPGAEGRTGPGCAGGPRERTYNWRMWTRATRAISRRRTRRQWASGWKW
jgi:hypothetical protein